MLFLLRNGITDQSTTIAQATGDAVDGQQDASAYAVVGDAAEDVVE